MEIPERAQRLNPGGVAAIPEFTTSTPPPPPSVSGRRPRNEADGRPFGELRDSGLLHLINREVFHPRGYALALVMVGGTPVGWELLGDGTEPWTFTHGGADHLARAEATFAANRRAAQDWSTLPGPPSS